MAYRDTRLSAEVRASRDGERGYGGQREGASGRGVLPSRLTTHRGAAHSLVGETRHRMEEGAKSR